MYLMEDGVFVDQVDDCDHGAVEHQENDEAPIYSILW